MALKSSLFRGDALLEAAAVSSPAHIVPGASGDHVRKIQRALTLTDSAGLILDGIYGPNTANAVLAYKQKRAIINRSYQTQADDIVGVMTMVALDAEMAAREHSGDGVPAETRSRFDSCDTDDAPAGGKGSTSTSDLQPPNPALTTLAASLIVNVRIAIRAALLHLDAANSFVRAHEKLVKPDGLLNNQAKQSIDFLIDVFSLDQLQNPRPGFDNIRRVYENMVKALNRSFETDPLIAPVLFVANTHVSKETALAYTVAGGAFLPSTARIKRINEPANRIYICNSILQVTRLKQTSVLIHELAHFVSGQPLKISHRNGVPKQGSMIDDRKPLDLLKPEAKLRSPEHYAFFALRTARNRI